MDRDTLLNPPGNNRKKTNDGLFLITRYNPNNPNLAKTVRKNWAIFADNATTRQSLLPKSVTFGHRRPKNLGDDLVRARVPIQKSTVRQVPGTSKFPCPRKDKCKICPHLDKSGKITSHTTNIQYESKKFISCKSSNVIYLVICKACGLQYVGQTKRNLYERFSEHFRDIRNKKPKLLCVHMNSANHNGAEDMQIAVLSFIKQAPDSQSAQKARDKMEMFWYNQLGTMVPRGLNVEKTAKKSYQ